MKIAFLNIYSGLIERGAEIFVQNLAGKLSSNHIVLAFQSGKTINASYKEFIYRMPLIKSQNMFYHLIVLWFTLRALPDLWKQNPDWIVPINGRLQVLLIRVFRKLKNGKILISGQAGIGFEDKWNIKVGNPNVFIALTPKAKQWATNLTKKVEYIPNGVDVNHFTPDGQKAILPLKKPIVLVNSALLEYKRINLAIQAVAKLKDASLLVIGDGPLKNSLEKYGKALLGKRFLLLPYVEHEKIPQYYRSASVFTLPSRKSEAFGLVYLEGLASNIPVVAPKDQNRKVLIGDAGVYCNVEDSTDYAKALEAALKKNWEDKPQKQAQKFTWDRVSHLYEYALKKY